MKISYGALASTCAALALVSISSGAAAQATPPDGGNSPPANAAPPPPSGPDGQGDIIITAQKTSTLASKTPIALSVFTGKDLDTRGVYSVADLQNIAPALNVGSAARGANITIRGVGTTDISSKGEQGVSFNIDGVPTGVAQIMSLAFLDLDRVEVLRGPQGTLYGKSSTGGAINLITNKPKFDTEASASFELGNYNARRGEAMINVPVVDDVFALRAAAVFNKRDGFILPVLGAPAMGPSQRALDDEDNWMVRLTGLVRLGSHADFTLAGTYGKVGGTGNDGSALWFRVINNNRSGSAAARSVFYNPYAGVLHDKFYNITGILNADLGDAVHFTYTGARIHLSTNDDYQPSVTDPVGGGGTPNYTWTAYGSTVKNDSHEIRFSNARPGPLTWVVGANYTREYIFENDLNWQVSATDLAVPPTSACPTPNYLPACYSPNPMIIGPTTHSSKGVFGQGSYAVSDQFKFTLGARYSDDKATRTYTIAAGPGPLPGGLWPDAAGNPCGPPNACIGNHEYGESKSGKLTWRLGADWTPAPNQLFYASVATGYKGGSFNDFDPVTHATKAYGPEDLIAYEVGYKGRPIPTLQFNSALYYYDYKHFQLTGATFLTPNITGGAPYVLIYTTTPPMKLYGWENELTWTPTRDDTVGLSAALANGSFGKGAKVGFIFVNQVDWSGKRPDSLATFSGTASYEHRFHMATGGFVSARVQTKFSNGYYLSDLGGQGNPFTPALANPVLAYSLPPTQYRQPGFTRTDLSLGYTSAGGKWSIMAYVRNVENKLQFIGAPQGMGTGNSDRVFARVADPRTFGARLSISY